MRFTLIDRIVELSPGESIQTIKTLSLSEEYLADHFPLFPVMPGVLMLEAMTQSAAWLVRVSEDFAHSVVVLREARNLKFSDFVAPGGALTVKAEVVQQTEELTTLKVQGSMEGRICVQARLVLHRYNLADSDPDLAARDEYCKRDMRQLYSLLSSQPEGAPAMAS